MIYRRLSADGDYMFGGNKNNYVSGVEAVRQAILTRLRQLKYEWWEDLEDGLPLWQDIAASRNTQAATKEVEKRIQGTKNVKYIVSLESEWDNDQRTLTINAVVETDFGQITVQEGGKDIGLL